MHIVLEDGTTAKLESASGERVRVRSARAGAPGERLQGRLASGTTIRLKVSRCVREGDAFLIEAKLLDATKAVLEELGARS
jgi:hypothetical protein